MWRLSTPQPCPPLLQRGQTWCDDILKIRRKGKDPYSAEAIRGTLGPFNRGVRFCVFNRTSSKEQAFKILYFSIHRDHY